VTNLPPPNPPAVEPAKPGIGRRVWGTYRGWPLWARIATPVVALVLIAAAFGEPPEEADASTADTTATTEVAAFDDAEAAAVEIDVEDVVADLSVTGLDTAELAALVEDSCTALAADSADVDDVAGDALEVLAGKDVVAEIDADTVNELADALGEAMPEVCPDAVATHPELLTALVAVWTEEVEAAVPETTTTTAPPTTTTTAPPPTTTPPPPPPPPPAPAPAPAPAPRPPAPSSTYFQNCTAARAAGAAPVHRGDPGYGSHLDRDNDGVGCE